MTQDSRKKEQRTKILCFKKFYTEFLNDNKGYSNVLDYIQGEYEGDKDKWAKVARWAGHKCIKRNGIYYFEA